MRNSSSHKVVKVLYFIAVAAVIVAIAYSFKILAVPVLLALILKLLLDPVVAWFESRGMKRMNVLIGLSLSATLVLVVLGAIFIPAILRECKNIVSNLPVYKQSFIAAAGQLHDSALKLMPGVSVPDFQAMLTERLSKPGGFKMETLFHYLPDVFEIFMTIALVPIITFFFLADGHLINKFLMSLVPNTYFEMSVLLVNRVLTQIRQYIRGQMLDAAYVGLCMTIGLLLTHTHYAIVLGILSGLGNLIPYVGPSLGLVAAALLMLLSPEGLTNITPLLWLGFCVFLTHFTEIHFVYPIVVGNSVDLHPLVVILGVVVGGTLAGIVGMLLAVPIMGIAKVSFETVHSYLKSYSII